MSPNLLLHADLQFTTDEFRVVEGQLPALTFEYDASGVLSTAEPSGHMLVFIAGSGKY